MPKRRKRTNKERHAARVERMLRKAREYTIGTYMRKYVAPVFQQMIRAEAGAEPTGYTRAYRHCMIVRTFRREGEVVCVTCSLTSPWSSGLGGMHTGHFLGRANSLIFEESNVAPQCSRCNRYKGGEQQRFRRWMESVRGQGVIDRLERLMKTTKRTFTREELVELRIGYMDRLKAAKDKMNQS